MEKIDQMEYCIGYVTELFKCDLLILSLSEISERFLIFCTIYFYYYNMIPVKSVENQFCQIFAIINFDDKKISNLMQILLCSKLSVNCWQKSSNICNNMVVN